MQFTAANTKRWVNLLQHVAGMQGIATTTKLRVCVLWNVVCVQGTAANTEPETVAVGNTILARRRNIRVYATLHSYGEHQSRVRMHHPTLLKDPRNHGGKQNLPIVARVFSEVPFWNSAEYGILYGIGFISCNSA